MINYYHIKPVAKPRMTNRDKWANRPCVLRYMAFKDECRLKGLDLQNGDGITFLIGMPKSWSKKKRAEMDGKPHLSRPDVDNYLKAVLDAIYCEDSHIYRLEGLSKYWATNDAIIVDSTRRIQTNQQKD